jgi:hypothetical protein
MANKSLVNIIEFSKKKNHLTFVLFSLFSFFPTEPCKYYPGGQMVLQGEARLFVFQNCFLVL